MRAGEGRLLPAHQATVDRFDEPYFKIEKVIPVHQLATLNDTFCPIDRNALLASSLRAVRFYTQLANFFAQEHQITYPEALEKMLIRRLENLQNR